MTKFTRNQDFWVTYIKENPAKFFQFFPGLCDSKNPQALLFYNPTNRNSMRLTTNGFNFFKKNLKIIQYEFTLQSMIMPKQLLLLERHILYPYYIQNLSKLIVFDETTAVMLQLHNGNLNTYLDNLEAHK